MEEYLPFYNELCWMMRTIQKTTFETLELSMGCMFVETLVPWKGLLSESEKHSYLSVPSLTYKIHQSLLEKNLSVETRF